MYGRSVLDRGSLVIWISSRLTESRKSPQPIFMKIDNRISGSQLKGRGCINFSRNRFALTRRSRDWLTGTYSQFIKTIPERCGSEPGTRESVALKKESSRTTRYVMDCQTGW